MALWHTDKNQFAPVSYMFDLEFSVSDGMKLFTVGRGNSVMMLVVQTRIDFMDLI